MWPAAYNVNYEPWRTQIPTLLCPSDTASLGTVAYGHRFATRFRDVLDGLSHTIAMAEIQRSHGSRELAGDVLVRNGSGSTMRNNPMTEILEFARDPERPLFYRPDVTLAVDTSNQGNRFRGANWAQGGCHVLMVLGNLNSCFVHTKGRTQ